MIQPQIKLSLLAVAVSAALAACGGGGGDGATTTTPTSTGTTTTGTTTGGQTLTANTGSSSGTASNTNGTNSNINGSVVLATPVPAANVVVTSVPASTYSGQAVSTFNSINEWRGKMRIEENDSGSGTVDLGVGLLEQRANLDTYAASLRASLPSLPSAADAQTALTALGYETGYVISGLTANTLGVTPGNFCAKSLFSSVPGMELASAGVRYIGMSVPEDTSTGCVVVAGIPQNSTWQLPPTGSSSVYPFPGKQLTVPTYYGDATALGFAAGTTVGHAVLVNLASNDALPISVSGIGTAIPTSQITVLEFNVKLKSTGAAVPARLFSQAGVVGSGVTLNATTQLLFPTSILLVPEAPLTGASVYTATFRATVRGRTVTRTWDFTTA